MYLRQTNKWKEFALQEGIEDIGLPPEVANYLRRQNQTYGPVSNKHLTWIGTLIKAARSSTDLPIVVGGGIRGAEAARRAVESGADWVVTGNLGEEFDDADELKAVLQDMIKAINP